MIVIYLWNLNIKKMKIKSKKFFKKLYLCDNIDDLMQSEMNNFLMCGDVNWDYYFEKKIQNSEKIENIKLIEFYTKKDFNKYLSKIDKYKLQDCEDGDKYFAILELV